MGEVEERVMAAVHCPLVATHASNHPVPAAACVVSVRLRRVHRGKCR